MVLAYPLAIYTMWFVILIWGENRNRSLDDGGCYGPLGLSCLWYFQNKTLSSLVMASPLLSLVWTLRQSATKATFSSHHLAVILTLLTHIMNHWKELVASTEVTITI